MGFRTTSTNLQRNKDVKPAFSNYGDAVSEVGLVSRSTGCYSPGEEEQYGAGAQRLGSSI